MLKNSKVVGTQGADGAQTTGTAPVTTGKGKGKADKTELVRKGAAIIEQMSDEEKQALGSKSATLRLEHLLGLESDKTSRKTTTGSLPCATAVGAKMFTTEDIKVPVIDIKKNKNTGITAEDITYRDVKANSEFVLSYYELMFLIIRPEYSGVCANKYADDGVIFEPKTPKFLTSQQKLPTPSFRFTPACGKSIKEGMVSVDVKGADGKWVIKEEYAEKFGDLVKKSKVNRGGSSNTKKAPGAYALSAALRQCLNV